MKKIALLFGMACLPSAVQAEEIPTLQGASGVIVKSLGSYDTFSLDAGDAIDCVPGQYVDRCRIVNGSITIDTSAGTEESITVDRYTHSKSLIGELTIEDWTYHGVWVKRVGEINFAEPVSLRILERSDSPGTFYGYFKASDLAISHQLRAVVRK